MTSAAEFPSNPRIFIGANGGPQDETDKPTMEEARIVASAIEYVQAFSHGLEELLTKRKGGRILGWRLALANVLKDRVRQNSLRQLLGFNRKTMGENQQRCDVWAEYDDENGDGSFGRHMEALRDAVTSHSYVDRQAIEAKLKAFVKLDPELRKLEEKRREHEAAALEAERAAAELQDRAKKRKRQADAASLEKTLKGVRNAKAIAAEHIGAERLALILSDAAIAVIEKTVKADMKAAEKTGKSGAKGERKLASELDPAGLKECMKYGLVLESIPHLSPRPSDPPIIPKDLGHRVFLAAVEAKRIKAKKGKA